MRWVIALLVMVSLVIGVAVTWFQSRPPRPPSCDAKPLERHRFDPPVQVTKQDSPGVYQFEPSAVLLGNGGVAAVFIENTGRFANNTIGAATLTPAGQVDARLSLPTKKEQHFDPWLARDRQGRLYAVWLGFDKGFREKRMQVALSTSDDGGRTWSEPRSAHDPKDCPEGFNGCMDKPMIAVGPDREDPSRDAVYVLYFSAVTGSVRAARSQDRGQTFQPAVDAAPSAYANVDVTPRGVLHLSYMTADEEFDRFGDAKARIEYVRSEDGGKTFTKPVVVSDKGQPVPFFFSNPAVAADEARGLLYVAYPSGPPDARWDVFLATSKDAGQSWTRVKVNDDASCANHMVPNVALDPETGDVHVIWLENRGGPGGVAYTRCASGGGACDPNEAVNDKPFASYGLKRHDPEWLGEYNTLLFDPARRELHAVWSQTVDDGQGARARIFHSVARLPKP
ncbi:MAG TPA: sialidase family protein [Myxococcaceae bacterium]|nr:sialidase family protein [Myxococcaceae bacterium]